MVIRLLLVAVTFVAACRFKEGDFGDRACDGDEQCAPDERCISNLCAQTECTAPTDCGASHQFDCVEGHCVVRTCQGLDGCEPGFDCAGGLCIAACADHDGDSYKFGPGCTDTQDCD